MAEDAVVEVLGAPDDKFVRVQGFPPEMFYRALGLFAGLSGAGTVAELEAAGDVPVVLGDVQLTDRPFDEVVADMTRRGFALEVDRAGATDRAAGIGLSRDAEDGVESVVILPAENQD